MYDDAMSAIHEHLIQKSMNTKMTYTAELIPEQHPNGEMYVFYDLSLSSHRICFYQLMATDA
jgi:mannosyl-oligosaccharide alpha-1,2-mannosidase